MDFYYLLINLTFIISGFILGLILLAFPIPNKEFLKNYRFSSKMLAFAYISLATISSYGLFFDLPDYQTGFINFSDIFISSTQSLIFSYTLIILLNPNQNNKDNILFKFHALAILLFLLVFVVYSIVDTDPALTSLPDLAFHISHPLTILRIAFFAFYLYQIISYSLIVHKSILKYNTSINNYFSETGKIKLKWVKIAFLSALIIGLMAIVFQTIPGLLIDNIFTSVIVVFYIVFTINFINYNKIYQIIEPAMNTDQPTENDTDKIQKKSSWIKYKNRVVENRIYLKEGITLIEMAQVLNVSRTTLSNFINTEENQNFNSWINQLRISEAKNLMASNPEYSISTIAMQTGYSEQSNFSREFKLITGETPSAWKKQSF